MPGNHCGRFRLSDSLVNGKALAATGGRCRVCRERGRELPMETALGREARRTLQSAIPDISEFGPRNARQLSNTGFSDIRRFNILLCDGDRLGPGDIRALAEDEQLCGAEVGKRAVLNHSPRPPAYNGRVFKLKHFPGRVI